MLAKAMVRHKNGALRIAISGDAATATFDYLLIEAGKCAASTFNNWGRKTADAVVEVDGRKFRVSLEPIESDSGQAT